MKLGRTTQILRIFDEAKAKEFYVDFLGFTIDWEHRFESDLPLYMQEAGAGGGQGLTPAQANEVRAKL